MRTISICLARMGSSRNPGKVLQTLGTMRSLLHWTVNASACVPEITTTVLATTTLPADDEIEDYCKENSILCYRGSEKDVLDRFYQCALHYKAEIVIRLTCDCPFLDPNVISEVITLRRVMNADYASNCYPPTYPDGLDVDCMTFAALETAWKEATSQIDRDCLTQFIVRNRDRFKVVNLTCPIPGLVNEHWVCDSIADFTFCQEIAQRASTVPSYTEILGILDKEPHLRDINKGSIRNERFYDGLSREPLPPRLFRRSSRLLERARSIIPSGAQTFSKSYHQLPVDYYPLYCTHGEGGYIFDCDGFRYVDLVSGLLPVILGYCDPDVDAAIRHQLDKGITLSLATELESELAELLIKHIPCAEMVRFGKSGTDVTTAAVRLARAYTGRSHVMATGYHGWADWSMSRTDRNSGIPGPVRSLTHLRLEFDYEYYAAIIVEPNDDPDKLKWLRGVCDKFGIVLIFDEVITGFRYSLGGAQGVFGVTPDLACFGKGMANGMPISALVGKKQIMKKLDTPDVFYSGTFFGETLSMAAAIATINKLKREDVLKKIYDNGLDLQEHIQFTIEDYGLEDSINVTGWPTNTKISFNNFQKLSADQMRALFMSEMAQNGVLIINCNGLTYAHGKPELDRVKTAYDETMNRIMVLSDSGTDMIGIPATPLRKTA